MINAIIHAIFSNPSVTLIILGIVFSLISLYRKPKPLKPVDKSESFISYFFLFTVGIGMLNNFVMHTVFADYVSKFIGWPNSPFQYEVGYASIGMGVAGILSFKNNISFRLASFIPLAFFLWGAAGGHIYEIIVNKNLQPGNAGAVLWTDILLPVLGFALIYWHWKNEKSNKLSD